ncbi:MAG: hypothetical protein ABID09_02520 [Candidatus Omnitrophota bacterium]
MVWLKFTLCAAIILFAGKHVARNADIIAEKTRLGGLWVGLILVSVTTSLPELFTGVGSVVFLDAPDLSVGNLLGANSYNLLNIALLDVLKGGTPLLSVIGSGHLLTALFGLLPVMLVIIAIALQAKGFAWSAGNIGVFSILIFFSYCIATRVIYKLGKKGQKEDLVKSTDPKANRYEGVSLKKAYIYYGVAALLIVASGVWLAFIGKEISTTLHLGESFIGSLLLGFATTLPEITVSVVALHMGAREIAIANMLGSNMFNMSIIFIDDILYRKAPILQVVSPDHILQGVIVMAMTTIVILALVTRSKRKILSVSWYVPFLLILFLAGAYLNFGGRF